jgi:hypothetical protein
MRDSRYQQEHFLRALQRPVRDLLHRIEEEVLQDLNNIPGYYNCQENKPESFQVMENIFEYIVENSDSAGPFWRTRQYRVPENDYDAGAETIHGGVAGQEMPNSEVADYLCCSESTGA